VNRFTADDINSIQPYVPGEQPQDGRYIKLNTNESPFPPSPAVLDVIHNCEYRLYQDTQATELRQAIADTADVGFENIFVSNGSDETLAFCFRAFGKGGVCFADITYGFYKVYSQLYNTDSVIVPLREEFLLDTDDYMQSKGMIIIANPNAPTGLYVGLSEIERLVRSNRDSLVIVDEAYIDFGGQSAIVLTKKYDNIMVVQTFSKSRSLAGLRLGFAIAEKSLIESLVKVKDSTNPYNVNVVAQLAGRAAVLDGDYTRRCCNSIMRTRDNTIEELRRAGFYCTDSKANFIFARHPDIGGERLYLALKEKGILVRQFNQDRIADYIRVTVGTDEQMERFFEETINIIKRGCRD